MSVLTNGQGTGQGTGSSQESGQGQGTGSQSSGTQGTQDWRSALPEDLRAEKAFESVKGKDWSEAGPELAKQWLHAQRLVGADKVVIPGEKASEQEWNDFYKKLGRPDKPDGYETKLPEGIKPELIDSKRLDTWKANLHKLGVPKGKAEQLIHDFIKDEFTRLSEDKKMRAAEVEKGILSLKQELGDKFDEHVNYAHFALKEFGDKEGKFAEFLDATGLGDHPLAIKMFAEIGRRLSDPKPRSGQGSSFGSAPASKAEAQARLNQFNADERKTKALFDVKDPLHDAVVAERKQLFELAFAEDK